MQWIHNVLKWIGNAISWVWFWITNLPLAPNKKERAILKELESFNGAKLLAWVYISVFLNLAPFGFAAILDYLSGTGSHHLLRFLNNGSVPILAYSLLATNFFYLLENIPAVEDAKWYMSIKTKTYVVAILTMFLSAILYVLQSNFLAHFTNQHLWVSLWTCFGLIFFAIVLGLKMYLLQQNYIEDFASNMNRTRGAVTSPTNSSGYEQ